MLAPVHTTWNTNSEGHLLLLKIPGTIDLYTSPSSHSHTSVSSLPNDLFYMIIAYLHPIDRVCLALTTKSLCAAVLTSPPLRPSSWTQFTSLSPAYASRNPTSYMQHALLPEIYSLTLRLAHGWVNKLHYRYCWKCHRILTRDEATWRQRLPESQSPNSHDIHTSKLWFGKRTVVVQKPPALDIVQTSQTFLFRQPRTNTVAQRKLILPKWSIKTGVDETTWNSWNRTQRYDHLVKTWCYAKNEDSSCLYCEHCQSTKADHPTGLLDGACGSILQPRQSTTSEPVVVDSQSIDITDVLPSSSSSPGFSATTAPSPPPLPSWAKPLPSLPPPTPPASKTSLAIHPVQCPSCLERELTWVWRQQRRNPVDGLGRPMHGPVRELLFDALWGLVKELGRGTVQVMLLPVTGVVCLVGLCENTYYRVKREVREMRRRWERGEGRVGRWIKREWTLGWRRKERVVDAGDYC